MTVAVCEFADHVNVPRSVLDGIWQKAQELISDSNVISSAPGYNKGYNMVKSSSGKRPHLVISKANGQYSCDNDCGNSNPIV